MKKRIADLSPEEQETVRAYNREQKQKSRAAQKAARYIPTADEVFDAFPVEFPERTKQLSEYAEQFSNKVVEELRRELGSAQKDPLGNVVGYDHSEEFVVDRVARCLLSLKKGWVQKVQEGELVSGLYFPESSGSVVEAAHRYGLKHSQTFSQLYFELLKTLDKRYQHEQTEDAAIIRAELAGEYVLKLPMPKPEPMPTKIPDVPSVPSDAEMLEQGRNRLLNQLQPQFRVQEPNISPQARQYLDGIL